MALEGISSGVADLGSPCEERFDRFVDNGDETVTDTCTGLMWQRKGADIDGVVLTVTWLKALLSTQ